MTVLACKNLTKKFGRKTAVNDLSLSLEAGRILGIIGPNGAGKSTLIKMITGLIWPDQGQVTIHGCDVHRDHIRAMRRTGAIIEWPAFVPYLSARRNLEILSGGHGQEYRRKLEEIVSFVELQDRLDDQVGTFSTGMKQRLGIALALLPDSEFIILDEPTNGLDPGGIVEIRTIIREYNRRYNTTIILTSHMLGEIEQICHDIALINNGHLAAFGKIEDLLHREKIIVVQCDQTEKAANILRQAEDDGLLPLEHLLIEDCELHLQVGHDCAAEINRLLVSQGIMVGRLTLKQKRLEEFFLEATTTEKMPCGAMSATK